jgi:hypothetical protein
MSNVIDNLLRTYTSVRELLQTLRIGTHSGVQTYITEDVLALSEAVIKGDLQIGSRVSGKGWLSPYAYWYLPSAYSPYRFHSIYARSESETAVKMSPSPAYLPAGQIPFERDDSILGFLYPLSTSGFTLQLANPVNADIPIPKIDMRSPDEQPWIFNMDTCVANYSMNPERWIYTVGDSSAFDTIPDENEKCMILTDPARVRDVVEIPPHCKPIPVLFPRGHCPANRYVEFNARLVELDSNVLQELSGLGSPLTQKVYSLFYQPNMGFPAYCLRVDGDETYLRPTDPASLSEQSSQKSATLLVEFFFESESGEILSFGDEELLQLVIPAMKDHVLTMDDAYYCDRWLSKVYGFDGAIYLVKNAPIEMSISPNGTYCTYITADLENNLTVMLPLLERFVQHFQRNMIALYSKRLGKTAVVRTTYLTSKDWQLSFGKLLDGKTFEMVTRQRYQFNALRRELQDAVPQNLLINNGTMVNSPIQQATIDSTQSLNVPSSSEA